jgi:diguanylate cyclase (GGDEF)-like protein
MSTNPQTVLIVDDAPTNIEILCEALSDTCEILFATGGAEALEIARDQTPDLILLDVMMPEMDGYEVCTRLKSEPRTRAIPVIFVTAKDLEEDEARGLEIGAIDYVTKPISPAIVRARVRNHLELKRYRDMLERSAATDGLTGLANRRSFDATIDREWRRAQRLRTPLALLMMDVDHFKAFNDHYGHLAGDDCLRQIAAALGKCARRATDLIARYGGEEFACILPETGAEAARSVAQRILEEVRACRVRHAPSSEFEYVTLSIGLAVSVPNAREPISELIRKADALLYQAKHAGRNCLRAEE